MKDWCAEELWSVKPEKTAQVALECYAKAFIKTEYATVPMSPTDYAVTSMA